MPTRNVINVSDVELFVEDFAQRTDHPALKRWLSSNVRRWILKHYDHADRVVLDPASGTFALTDKRGTLQPFTGAVPDWCEAAIARGDEVVHLRLGATLAKRVGCALAALAADLEDGTLPSPDRIPFPKAEAKARKQRYAGHIARRKTHLAKADSTVHRSATGDTIVRLTTRESLVDEGNRMSHCVAIYDQSVKDDECEIYSLRDSDGKSRATIEVDHDGIVQQIKGYANGEVPLKYRGNLRDFIASRDYIVKWDRHNLVTREADPDDRKQLEKMLVEEGGLDWLHANRFADHKTICDADTRLFLHSIICHADKLPASLINAVLQALKPDAGTGFRVRAAYVFGVYDITVAMYCVELPLPLLNLVYHRTFRGRTFAGEAAGYYRNAEAALVRLALHSPQRLYALGPVRVGYERHEGLLESPAALIRRSAIDLTPLRNARRQALRSAMNQAKDRSVGRRAKPSQAHIAVRQLLDGSRRQYVL